MDTQSHGDTCKGDLQRHTRPQGCPRGNGGPEAQDADEHAQIWEDQVATHSLHVQSFGSRNVKAPLYAHPAGALSSALSRREAQTSQTPLLSWSSWRKMQDPKFSVLQEQRAGTKQIKGWAPSEGQRSDTEHQGGFATATAARPPVHTQDTH